MITREIEALYGVIASEIKAVGGKLTDIQKMIVYLMYQERRFSTFPKMHPLLLQVGEHVEFGLALDKNSPSHGVFFDAVEKHLRSIQAMTEFEKQAYLAGKTFDTQRETPGSILKKEALKTAGQVVNLLWGVKKLFKG